MNAVGPFPNTIQLIPCHADLVWLKKKAPAVQVNLVALLANFVSRVGVVYVIYNIHTGVYHSKEIYSIW